MAIPKTFCPAVAIYDSSFTTVDAYYRMFPHEMSDQRIFGLDIQAYKPVNNITFRSLLETMRDSLRQHPTWDDFLIAAHGFHNEMDYAYGLTMPLAPQCTMKTVGDILEVLLDFMNNDASDKAIDDYETGDQIKNIKINNKTPVLAKGCLKKLVHLMRELRDLKVRRVEIRACTLGTNPRVLSILGQCMSARWISAPDKHMFYSRVNPGIPVSDAKFKRDLQNHADARVFTNGSASFAYQVQGRGVFRNSWAQTTTRDLSWFVDQFIWDDNKYPRGTTNPAPFIVAGMDLSGSKRYALPQEPEYAQHIVMRGPLPGNKI